MAGCKKRTCVFCRDTFVYAVIHLLYPLLIHIVYTVPLVLIVLIQTNKTTSPCSEMLVVYKGPILLPLFMSSGIYSWNEPHQTVSLSRFPLESVEMPTKVQLNMNRSCSQQQALNLRHQGMTIIKEFNQEWSTSHWSQLELLCKP